jgi:hypothetical protein
MSYYISLTVDELKKANEKFENQLAVLAETQASIKASEEHIKRQTGYTLAILVLTALIAGIDVYSRVFGR